MIYRYQFTGYPAYQEYRQEIKDRILKATEDDDLNYYIAVNEAVCNAARYGIAGPLKTEIAITLKIEVDNLQTEITSSTWPFNFIAYRQKLRTLAANEKTQNMDWPDSLGEAASGRGIWLMLAACSYLLIEKDGRSIQLTAPLPWKPSILRSQMDILVSRFFILDNGLVM